MPTFIMDWGKFPTERITPPVLKFAVGKSEFGLLQSIWQDRYRALKIKSAWLIQTPAVEQRTVNQLHQVLLGTQQKVMVTMGCDEILTEQHGCLWIPMWRNSYQNPLIVQM